MAPRYCTNCGTPLPEDAVYCPACGAAVRGEAPLPGEQPTTAFAADATHQLSGWWRRVGAYLIDGVVILAVMVPLVAVFIGIALAGGVKHVHSGGTFQFHYDDHATDASGGTYVVGHHVYHVVVAPWFWPVAVIGVMLAIAVQWGYSPFLMRRAGQHNGQTIGRQATGIRVVRDTGAPVGFWFAVLRETVIKSFLISTILLVPLLGWVAVLVWFLWPLWDSSNRAPQDMMVKTHVVIA